MPEKLLVPRLMLSGFSGDSQVEVLGLALAYHFQQAGVAVNCVLIGSDLQTGEIYSGSLNRSVRCLDPRHLSFDAIVAELSRASLGCELLLIISPYAFFDSPKLGMFTSSPAEIAVRTGTPVVFTVDFSEQSNGLIAQLKGYKDFASNLDVQGVSVIYRKHRAALNQFIADPKPAEYGELLAKHFDFRILELIEHEQISEFVLPRNVDPMQARVNLPREKWFKFLNYTKTIFQLDKWKEAADQALVLEVQEEVAIDGNIQSGGTRIAVAKDPAFALCYQSNLELLRYYGARIITFSPLVDNLPEDIGALYLPGTLLKDYGEKLSEREELAGQIRDFVESGGILYAEGSSLALISKEFQLPGYEDYLSGWQVIPAKARLRSPDVQFGTAMSLRETILGSADQSVSFYCVQNYSYDLYRTCPTALKYNADSGTRDYAFVPSPNVFATEAYLNFASSPEIALSLLDAANS